SVEKTKQGKKRNFDQSIDLIVNLKDVDLKKPGSKLNELVELPNQVSENVKVCVIGSGQLVLEAKKAEADGVIERSDLDALGKDKKAARKLAEKYDFFICEAPLMPLVGKVAGTFLGPRGKMPTPVPPNSTLAPVIERHRKMVRLRLRDQPIIQCKVGTENMEVAKVTENVEAVLRLLYEKLESGNRNVKSTYVKATMGESIPIEFGEKKK
ncbi:MAG: 50S ribosomal protein L1, partial [Candidatus Bathyarchaeota archaeon]